MMRQLFLDLDGVLANFDGYYESQFGVKPDQDTYSPPEFWDCIGRHGSFYRDLPPMPDAHILWHRVYHLKPIILSGIPYSIPNVASQKRTWVNKYLGSNIPLICCPSRLKRDHGKPGDALVDDRLKYAHHWTEMGGVFIHHTGALSTLAALADQGFDVARSPRRARETSG